MIEAEIASVLDKAADDESLFFSSTLLNLLKDGTRIGHILSLSNGALLHHFRHSFNLMSPTDLPTR